MLRGVAVTRRILLLAFIFSALGGCSEHRSPTQPDPASPVTALVGLWTGTDQGTATWDLSITVFSAGVPVMLSGSWQWTSPRETRRSGRIVGTRFPDGQIGLQLVPGTSAGCPSPPPSLVPAGGFYVSVELTEPDRLSGTVDAYECDGVLRRPIELTRTRPPG